MSPRQRLLLIGFVALIVVALAVSGASVLAQDTGSPTPYPYPHGMMGFGWHGYGMMRSGDPVYPAIADALGIDTATLTSELQAGRSIAQIAEARDVDVQTVYDAALNAMEQHMNAQVEAGYIPQAQVDTWLTWMRENIAQMPMFTAAGFAPCMTGGNGMGMGMMGQGMWGHQGQGHHGGWMMGW